MKFKVGGDPESYMDPPALAGDSDGPSIFATILDALGIHKQVAKGDSKKKGKPEVTSPSATEAPAVQPVATPDILGSLSQTLIPDAGAELTPFGQKWMDSVKPLMTFDPGASKAKQS